MTINQKINRVIAKYTPIEIDGTFDNNIQIS